MHIRCYSYNENFRKISEKGTQTFRVFVCMDSLFVGFRRSAIFLPQQASSPCHQIQLYTKIKANVSTIFYNRKELHSFLYSLFLNYPLFASPRSTCSRLYWLGVMPSFFLKLLLKYLALEKPNMVAMV